MIDQHVFIWSDIQQWRGTTCGLLDDVLPIPCIHEAIHQYQDEYVHPEAFYPEHEEWLQQVLRRADIHLNMPITALIEERFRHQYQFVRAYHACRPITIEPYLEYGLLPRKHTAAITAAKDYFLSGEFPRITPEIFNAALRDVASYEHDEDVYLLLDNRQFRHHYSAYWEYGSEFRSVIAARLSESTGLPLVEQLREHGTPTVVVCDLPLSMIARQMRALSAAILAEIFHQVASPNDDVTPLEIAVVWGAPIPPTCIHSYYDPQKQDQ